MIAIPQRGYSGVPVYMRPHLLPIAAEFLARDQHLFSFARVMGGDRPNDTHFTKSHVVKVQDRYIAEHLEDFLSRLPWTPCPHCGSSEVWQKTVQRLYDQAWRYPLLSEDDAGSQVWCGSCQEFGDDPLYLLPEDAQLTTHSPLWPTLQKPASSCRGAGCMGCEVIERKLQARYQERPECLYHDEQFILLWWPAADGRGPVVERLPTYQIDLDDNTPASCNIVWGGSKESGSRLGSFTRPTRKEFEELVIRHGGRLTPYCPADYPAKPGHKLQQEPDE